MNNSNLMDMARELADLKARISALNEDLKALKDREADLKRSVLIEMGPAKSVNLEGVGRLVRKNNTRYEIRDIEALAMAMLKVMVANGKAGRPLSDGLLLQQRVSARNLEEVMDAEGLDEASEEAYINGAGLARVTEQSLSFTKN